MTAGRIALMALLMALAGRAAGAPAPPPTTTVTGGRLSGAWDAGVAAYKGLRYAAPPTGALRWAPPAPPPSWKGVKAATAYAPTCPQPIFAWTSGDTARQDEDCLALNVWTPAKQPGAKLPVMVWIHGGGYVGGAGSQRTYEGAELARRGVVVVTINYRLGVLGYLAHPELTAASPMHTSGNWGLLDQIAALKWVRANIAAFGGDPRNVTVFGQSAGGGSVMLLTVSPLARGLFQKAIMESGAALRLPGGDSPVTLRAAEAAGVEFAASVGAHDLAQLRAMSAQALVTAKAPPAATAPILDGKVVPADITTAWRGGTAAPVRVLLGWNSADGALFGAPQNRADYAARLRSEYPKLADRLLELYPAADDAQVPAAARAVGTDTVFAWRAWSLAEAAAHTARPAFLYVFDNPPPRGAEPRSTIGANHSDELQYVWGQTDGLAPWPPADLRLKGVIQGYWVNFARTGDPNGAGLPAWPAYAAGEQAQWFSGGQAHPAAPLRADRLKALDALISR